MLQLRHQQAAQQQLLQQQFQVQRQLLLDSQERAMKSHLLEYLEQHRRLEETVVTKKSEKSEVKSRLQEFVLQKKQRESQSSLAGPEEMVQETEATDAEVSLLLNSNSYFKALPRISPVQEDETAPAPAFPHSPRSCRSLASPWGGEVGPASLGSSSSSLLGSDSPRPLPTTYTPSPPRLPRLRPVSSMQYGRTQSAPLPLAHPGLLAPPEVRQGKTSPELEAGSLVKQQIRQSVLSRHHRTQHQPLDPMLAMAELSQMQLGGKAAEGEVKVRHSSTESGAGRNRPRPICRTR